MIVEEFENVNPDEYNEEMGVTESPDNQSEKDLSDIDTNGNGKVTIAEDKTAGFSLPIVKGHWLYEYMDDRNGDGMVGE